MDLGLSSDPYESFRLFQKQIHHEYQKMVKEFQFTVITKQTRCMSNRNGSVNTFLKELIYRITDGG